MQARATTHLLGRRQRDAGGAGDRVGTVGSEGRHIASALDAPPLRALRVEWTERR